MTRNGPGPNGQTRDDGSQENSVNPANRAGNQNELTALDEYVRELQTTPQDGALLLKAGMLARKLGQYDRAVEFLRRGFQILGTQSARHELILACVKVGKFSEAEELAKSELAKQSRSFQFRNLLGIIYRRMHRYEDAIKQLKLACELNPKDHSPYFNLGNVYFDMHDPVNAAEMFRRSNRINPNNSEGYRLFGRAKEKMGQLLEAMTYFKKCIDIDNKNCEGVIELVNAHCTLHEYEAAAQVVEKGIAASPNDPRLKVVQAKVLRSQGKVKAAAELCREVLIKHPTQVDALLYLGGIIEDFDRAKANEAFRQAVAADNRSFRTLAALCDSLNRSRFGSEEEHIQSAYEIACELLDKHPARCVEKASALKNVLLRCGDFERHAKIGPKDKIYSYWQQNHELAPLLNEFAHVESMEDRLQLVAYHREWGRRSQDVAERNPISHKPATKREKIRVGFMSSDLRAHPVGYFASPLLRHYDKNRFEVHCYSFSPRPSDFLQDAIAKSVDHFRIWPTRLDREIAQGIADDQLDVLFEMGGPTDLNHHEATAYRAAPVQISWLGYAHSTGIPTIDYLLVDPYLMPADQRLLIEKPFQLPATWVTISDASFPVAPLADSIPQERNGWVTFGTMNNPYKYNSKLLDTWCDVLRSVPESRFLFVRPECGVPAFKANFLEQFGQRGIAPHRIKFIAQRGQHMGLYNEMDIALDTIPHTGGTTTCESIWMGVPTVTLVGPAFYERLSYSNLMNAGLRELCTFTREEYVQTAIALASDIELRRDWKKNMRQQIAANPLGQAQKFSTDFYAAVEKVVR